MREYLRNAALLALLVFFVTSCARDQRRTVTATAFNSTRAQTDRRPTESACGNRLAPGAKVIAVSRDLTDQGLTCGTLVRISGLPGSWIVADRTAARFTDRIDIYMGRDVQAARAWGVQRVEIRWKK